MESSRYNKENSPLSPQQHRFQNSNVKSRETPTFMNFLIKERKSSNIFIKDDLHFITPRKEKDEVSKFSMTPLSIVRKMQDISPGMTTHTKKHTTSLNSYKELNFTNLEFKKPKINNQFTSLFQHTVEKDADNFIIPKICSLEILPLDNLQSFQPQQFFTIEALKEKKTVRETDPPKKYQQQIFTGGCNCRNSKCLKLYCECLRKGNFCKDCNCDGCENHEESQIRQKKVKVIQKKNPSAFKPIIKQTNQGLEKVHSKGCNCKKSSCLKNYCECYQFGVGCASHCRCVDCKNKKSLSENSEDIGYNQLTHCKFNVLKGFDIQLLNSITSFLLQLKQKQSPVQKILLYLISLRFVKENFSLRIIRLQVLISLNNQPLSMTLFVFLNLN